MPHTNDSSPADSGLATILALESVPPVTTTRWIPRRKAQVVRAVQAGLLSVDEACRLYRLTMEEFESWQQALSDAGEGGLRVTRRAIGLDRPSAHWTTWEHNSSRDLVDG